MNRIANPGFEVAGATSLDAAGWTRDEAPFRSFRAGAPAARSGEWGAVISRASTSILPPVFFSGFWRQVAPVEAGRLHSLTAWARRDGDEPVVPVLEADGSEISRAVEVDGWQVFGGLVTPASETCEVSIELAAAGGALASSWFLDDVSLEEVAVPRGFEFAYRAIFERVRTINGSAGGYWHDLGGRVFARDVQPGTGAGSALPYACLPVDDSGAWPAQEGRHVTALLRQSVVIYLPRRSKETADLETSASIDALRMADDLLRCLMPEGPRWNLGDARILEVQLLERDVVVPDTGATGAFPFVEFVLGIKFTAGREDLGPSAS